VFTFIVKRYRKLLLQEKNIKTLKKKYQNRRNLIISNPNKKPHMKRFICLLVILSVISGCKKKDKGGNMLFKMQYTTTTGKSVSPKGSDSLYTEFGDYITSITPSHFSGKFQMLGFQDAINPTDNNTNMLLFIDGSQAADDPNRIADFSNNAVVHFSPDLRGIQDDHGLFTNEQINFIYFYFDVLYFYQEAALPPQYDTLNIDMFNGQYNNDNITSDLVKVNNILKIKHFALISKIFNLTHGWPSAYIFGNCDSTFVFNTEGNNVPNSVNWPFGGNTMLQIIRSNKYNMVTINTPGEGETVQMTATICFNTKNLIQIYAGQDNVPYTSDDVFIYAPNFWERIIANLIIE